MSEAPSPVLVGWREWVALPGLGIPRLQAKIDTGARTSSLHSFALDTFRREGDLWVRFGLHPLRRRTDREVWGEARVLDERVVRNASGHTERRLVIHTTLHLGSMRWPIELNLTNRDNMLYRMLLGRTAMQGRLRVDPSVAFLQGKPQPTGKSS